MILAGVLPGFSRGERSPNLGSKSGMKGLRSAESTMKAHVDLFQPIRVKIIFKKKPHEKAGEGNSDFFNEIQGKNK